MCHPITDRFVCIQYHVVLSSVYSEFIIRHVAIVMIVESSAHSSANSKTIFIVKCCLHFRFRVANFRTTETVKWRHSQRKSVFVASRSHDCMCNAYLLISHFYIAKLGYAGVYLFFFFLLGVAVILCTHNLWFEPNMKQYIIVY